jgi:rfaE bifunctional protein kinase chain/domain
MDLNKIKVLVVGDIMLDEYIQGDSNRISPEAPVPIVQVKQSNFNLGGAANVANNCGSLNANVSLIGIIGKDDPGEKVKHFLKKNNINYLGPISEDALTTRKVRVLSKSQQLLRIDYEKKAKSHFKIILSLFKKAISDMDLVIFSDYGKGTLDNIDQLIIEAKNNNKLVFVDPIGQEYSRYKYTDYIKPNQKELKQVIGYWNNNEELALKVKKLLKYNNIKNLILTMSEKGCIFFSYKNDKINSKIFPVNHREVFDVTGAGDAFIAIFSLFIAKGLESHKAINLANKGAGVVVEKLGTYNVKHADLLE